MSLTRKNQTEKERKKVNILLDRFYELETDKLAMILNSGCHDASVAQAIRIVLKERGDDTQEILFERIV